MSTPRGIVHQIAHAEGGAVSISASALQVKCGQGTGVRTLLPSFCASDVGLVNV